MAVRAAASSGDGRVLGAGGEQRVEGEPVDGCAAEAGVDDADGVAGEQGLGSFRRGPGAEMYPSASSPWVCHEVAARIAVVGLDGWGVPIYADAHAAAAAITARLSLRT